MPGTQSQKSAEPGAEDDILALALAEGHTRAEAARRAKLSQRTVYARLRDPAFVNRIAKQRARIVDESVGILSNAGRDAAKQLQALLKDPSSGIRLQAAKAIIDSMAKLADYTEIAARVGEIEARTTTLAAYGPRLSIPGADDRKHPPRPWPGEGDE